jgi:hypothetical protein
MLSQAGDYWFYPMMIATPKGYKKPDTRIIPPVNQPSLAISAIGNCGMSIHVHKTNRFYVIKRCKHTGTLIAEHWQTQGICRTKKPFNV